MPRIPFVGFIGPTYQSLSPVVDAERCVNLYPEVIDGGATGKNRIVYYGTPGLTSRATLGPTPGPVWQLYTCIAPSPGANAQTPRTFAVAGASSNEHLYEIAPQANQAAIVTDRGALTQPASGTVYPWSFSSNPTQVLIAGGRTGVGYIFDCKANTLTQVTASGWLGARSITFLDGYFIAVEPESQTFFISAYEDGTQWDPLDFATESDEPDVVVAVITTQRQVWLIGANRSQGWYNSGDANFPFARDASAVVETGCIAGPTLVQLDNTIFWLGTDRRGGGVVWRLQGYIPLRISTHAVETQIAGYPTLTDAVAFSYREKGHPFLVLTFPSGNATWVYDVATNLWHERGYWNAVSGNYQAALGWVHTYSYDQNRVGVHLVGDRQSNKVYEYSQSFLTDDGAAIQRLRRSPHVHGIGLMNFYSQLQLDCEVGDGPGTSAGTATLRWSNDGGRTWTGGMMASFGGTGAYLTRVQWQRLGSARTRAFEITTRDPIPIAWVNAYLDVEQGGS